MNNQFSFLQIFSLSDPVVLATSIILVIGSVVSWVIIIEKFRLWSIEKARPTKIRREDNLDLVVDRAIVPFDRNLWFLSMASVVAPFVGLFGTIWGIMMVFASIGSSQSASIAVVAPGLAVALGTTALGLVVAIPAAIAHQYFTKKSDDLYDALDDARKEIACEKCRAQ